KENPSYWEGRPYISALEFRIIPDPATLQAEFETGRLDFILLEDPTYRRYADDPAWKPYVVEVAELFTRHMGLNTTKPPLNDVRIRARLVQQEFGVMLDRAGKGELMAYVLSHGGGSNCVNYLGPFRSRNFGIAGNRMFYRNERVDALMDDAERTFDATRQIQLCREAERLIVADAPWFFWNYNKAALVHQPSVHGIVGNPLELDWLQMHKVWIQPR